jgi:hypothetical protein
VLAQIGRGLLAVALMLQAGACLIGAVALLWAGTFAWRLSSIPTRPRYEPVAAGILLVLAGAASLLSIGALTENHRPPRAQRLILLSLWAVIGADVLFPLELLALALVSEPLIRRDPYLLPSWAFWQVCFGLLALCVWTIARKPPFGWLGTRALLTIGTAAALLGAMVVLGEHDGATAFASYIRAHGRMSICASQPDSCWRPVDAATAQQAVARFGAAVAWIPKGQGVTPSFIRRESSVVVESARLNERTVLDLISDAKRFPPCPSSECSSGQFLELNHTRVWVYSRPDGGLNMAWARGGRSYRLYLDSYETRVTQWQGVSLFRMVQYAEPVPKSVLPVAAELYADWKPHDRTHAHAVASRRAVAQLFATPWESTFTTPASCITHPAGGFDCNSSNPGAHLFVLVARNPATSSYWVLTALACKSDPCYYVGSS